jgi:Cu-processing system permease protein
MKQYFIIAKYEFFRILKNRWLFGFTVLFAVLSLILLFISKEIYQGEESIGFTRLFSSLNNLIIILVPLISLLLSSQSISGDKSDKFYSLLKTYPIKLSGYIFGKYSGIFFAVLLSILLGFIFVVIYGFYTAGGMFIKNLNNILILIFILFAIFTSWGILLGTYAKSRLNALSLSLIIWFFIVFLYEILIWIILPKLDFDFQKPVLFLLIILNPAEFVRIIIVFLQKQGSIYGPDFYYWEELFNTGFGLLFTIFVIIIHSFFPLFLSIIKIKKEGKYV